MPLANLLDILDIYVLQVEIEKYLYIEDIREIRLLNSRTRYFINRSFIFEELVFYLVMCDQDRVIGLLNHKSLDFEREFEVSHEDEDNILIDEIEHKSYYDEIGYEEEMDYVHYLNIISILALKD